MFCNTSGGPEPIGEAGSKQEHRESEPVFSPFGISPNLQGAGAALFFDLGNQPAHPCRTDEGHSSRSGDLAEVRDQCTGPESSLVGRLADADPDVYDLIDMSDIEAADLDVFRAFVTKQLDYGAVRKDPLAKAGLAE